MKLITSETYLTLAFLLPCFSVQGQSYTIKNADHVGKRISYNVKVNSKREAFKKDKADALPIRVERTITFTTNEGSYIDVDISADGKNLAFTILGDIYILPATGGIAKQLTHGIAIKKGPKWSPDGNRIIYSTDASGFNSMHSINNLGKDDRVANSAEINFYDYSRLTNKKLMALPHELSIQIKDRRIIGNSFLSPNNRWLTYYGIDFARDLDSLNLIDLKTGRSTVLDRNLKIGNFSSINYAKDSRSFFICYNGKIYQFELETGRKVIIPFSANVNVGLGKLDYNRYGVSLNSFQLKHIRNVERNPNSKQIVFSALNKIYVTDSPNSKAKILTPQSIGQFQPAYSPDGKWIIYTTWSNQEGGAIWRVSSKGGTREQITAEPALYMHPSWSPDGSQIVVIKGPNQLGDRDGNGNGNLQIISLKEHSVKNIINPVSLFCQPVFSSDGQSVLFQPGSIPGELTQRPQLISVDLKTGKETILAITNADNNQAFIRQIVYSPDKRYYVFNYNENLYLAKADSSHNAQTLLDFDNSVVIIRFAREAIDPIWEKNGSVLSWVQSNKFYSVDPDKVIKAAAHVQPNATLDNLPKTKIIDVDIAPDQTTIINLKAPRLKGKGLIALKNVRIIIMHDNDVTENGVVLIENGRIIAVGKSGSFNIPKTATVLDLKGKTIMPGLIDMHGHQRGALSPDIHSQQSWERLAYLSFGTTTTRDPSGSFDSFGYNELVESGQMLGPRLFSVDHAVRSYYTLNSLKEANIIAKNRAMLGTVAVKQYQQPTRLQRQLLLLACERNKLNMTNEGDLGYFPSVQLGMYKDGSTGIEHNPNWAEVHNDVIQFIAKTGTYLCPTLQVLQFNQGPQARWYFTKKYGQAYLNRSRRFLPDIIAQNISKSIIDSEADTSFLIQSKITSRIIHAGGKVVMGSHGEDYGIGGHWEIWALQMGGLTNMEALRTATVTAAEGLGMQKDLGSIEVGKIADLLILDKNPLDDIHNTTSIKYVMKAGVLYESETLDEVWPNKVKCPEWKMKSKEQTIMNK